MNYLVSLSFSQPHKEITFGCLIAETGRSTRLHDFDYGIQRGINLHLAIRKLLENHPIAAKNAKRMSALLLKHNLEILEVYLDHFMALHWKTQTGNGLTDATQLLYKCHEGLEDTMHAKLRKVQEKLVQEKWLDDISSIAGLNQYLKRYIKFGFCRIDFTPSIPILMEHYEDLRKDFEWFYGDVCKLMSENHQTSTVMNAETYPLVS
ncbi:MAG: acyl carrier protein phosphodiesterase [Cytophagaceae bacterium]|jgi:acyl carrier protein phosphodiesterase|nr:acyl carrier protein phosphodiesterase [Cytophagaceae bacterium]